MSRVRLALRVPDLEASIAFYVAKADAGALTEQEGSACCATAPDTTATTTPEPVATATSSGCR
jgi:catechol 2,3-dioxygenase-like lactoylglutathione lyase family enzyme